MILTYSMVQSPSWAANWFAASQEIPRISRNPKVHYRTHKRPPTVSILVTPKQASRMWIFLNISVLQGGVVSTSPNPQTGGAPSSAVRDCLFNLFAATLLIGGRSYTLNLRTRHAVVTGTHYMDRHHNPNSFFAFYECLSTNGYLAYDHTWGLWGCHLVPRRRRSPESLDCRLRSHPSFLHPPRCGHRSRVSRIQILQLWCHSMPQSCNMRIIKVLNKTNGGLPSRINRECPISVDVRFVMDKMALGLIIPLLVAPEYSLISHVTCKIIAN